MTEDDLIQTFFAPLAGTDAVTEALKDDAAVLPPLPGHDRVITSDMLLSGVHFLDDDKPADIAWKAVAVNVSDLVAKGATPTHYTLSIGVAYDHDRAFFENFVAGLKQAQDAFGIRLIGGDTTRQRRDEAGWAISVTAIGSVAEGKAVRRGGAQPGDAVYVTGHIGNACLGLRLRLDSKLSKLWALGPAERGQLVDAYLRPQPDITLVSAIMTCATAAMDISDGLLLDAQRMALASGVQITIERARVPLSEPANRVVRAVPTLIDTMMTAGDDYCVLACVPPAYETEFQHLAGTAHRIGHVGTGNGVICLDENGDTLSFSALGYDHG